MGAAVGLAYFNKPDGASFPAVGVGLLYAPWRVADLAVPLVLLGYFHLAATRFEEAEPRQRFGATYAAYCERVPRWLPR